METENQSGLTSWTRSALNCSALPAAKKSAFSLNPQKQHHWRQRTYHGWTMLTCYRCGKHAHLEKPRHGILSCRATLHTRFALEMAIKTVYVCIILSVYYSMLDAVSLSY